jgi:hypothetical protein
MCESIFATLECELIDRFRQATDRPSDGGKVSLSEFSETETE